MAPVWGASFFLGSLTAAFCQGITLGALLQGVPVAGRAYAGGWWEWLTPFSLVTGLAIVPPTITIHAAAAPASSLVFLLVGTLILLPIILGYTASAYWVFRGKVRPDLE